MKLTKGMHFIVPADVSAGKTAEVFEVEKIVTMPDLPSVPGKKGSGTKPFTVVRMRGVNTGANISLGMNDLAKLGRPVQARMESDK